MLDGNKCELCNEVIKGSKALYKQTKYCQFCAKQKKKENTIDSWLPEKRKNYMRQYMQEYRRLNAEPDNERAHSKKIDYPKKNSSVTAKQDTTFFSFFGIIVLFLTAPLLENIGIWFDLLENAVKHLELFAIKITGFIFIISQCWKHISHLVKKENKKDDEQNL